MAESIATVGDLAGVCGHDGDGWQKVGISASKRLQVETEDPSGADLTDVIDKLDDCLTALEKIDDLQNALDSVGTDEFDVNVEGYDPVPTSPVRSYNLNSAVPNASWTQIVTYTVTAGTTCYVTDLFALDGSLAAGSECLYVVKIAGGNVLYGRIPTGHELAMHMRTPFKATSEQVIAIELYQWTGGAIPMAATIIGFEV